MSKGKKKTKLSINWQPNFTATLFALLFLLLSFLPSLLPRPSWIQGFITGLSMAIGYGIGLVVSSSIRWFVQREPSKDFKQSSWKILKYSVPLLAVVALIRGMYWQNDVRTTIGVVPIDSTYSITVVLVAILSFSVFYYVGKILKKVYLFLKNKFYKKVNARIAVGTAVFITSLITYFIVSGIFLNSFYTIADSIFSTRDSTAPDGIVQPESPNRSGSPSSIIPWEAIGFQGRGFVGSGPTAEQITEFNGLQAVEPIRVYAGMASAETAEERAQLALAELKRTNAFDRDVLVIATATGTGWLDPSVVDALEFIYNGDTAIVSQQYSYLPSWISFLVDQARAKEAGRVLYDAVLEEYIKLPENDRPKLLVYGLSLGSFGGQEAFSGINDIRRSVDGALFTGTPSATRLWSNVTENRDKGSPMWQPMYNNGISVRFASTIEDMNKDVEQWSDETRILYLQHANDPVVWFNFDLIFNKPDWLGEERGRGVSSGTRYYPIVTFLQIGLDQAVAASAPIGDGHYYIDTTVNAWVSILPPDNWSQEKTDRLQDYINNEFVSSRVKSK